MIANDGRLREQFRNAITSFFATLIAIVLSSPALYFDRVLWPHQDVFTLGSPFAIVGNIAFGTCWFLLVVKGYSGAPVMQAIKQYGTYSLLCGFVILIADILLDYLFKSTSLTSHFSVPSPLPMVYVLLFAIILQIMLWRVLLKKEPVYVTLIRTAVRTLQYGLLPLAASTSFAFFAGLFLVNFDHRIIYSLGHLVGSSAIMFAAGITGYPRKEPNFLAGLNWFWGLTEKQVHRTDDD